MAVRMRHHLGAVMPELRWEPTVDGVRQDRPITPWSTPEEQRGAAADRLEFG
jgi:hypothetical protein